VYAAAGQDGVHNDRREQADDRHDRNDDRRDFREARREALAQGRIYNTEQPGGSWGWHGGDAWEPQPHFWGGSFWGQIALGVRVYVPVSSDSPGDTLLANYRLIQAPCDPTQDLAEIYGPDDSTICALPNEFVPPGRYNIDMSTLTLQVTTDE
jgi:hypothetical protein